MTKKICLLLSIIFSIVSINSVFAGDDPCYRWNEARNPHGANRCSSSAQCDRDRLCNYNGWCQERSSRPRACMPPPRPVYPAPRPVYPPPRPVYPPARPVYPPPRPVYPEPHPVYPPARPHGAPANPNTAPEYPPARPNGAPASPNTAPEYPPARPENPTNPTGAFVQDSDY